LFKTSVKLDTLREIGKICESLVKEVRINFSPTGIEVRAVDGAHVGMIRLVYKDKVYTDTYTGEPAALVFSLESLLKTINLGKAGQTVQLAWNQEENRLDLKFGDIVRKMTLVDPDALAQDPGFPNVELPDYTILKLEDLLQCARSGAILGADGEIQLTLTKNGLAMHSENKRDIIDVQIPKERLDKIDVKADENSAKYPLKLFSDVINTLAGIEQVVLSMKSDNPIRLQFDLSGGAGTGRFLLAPRTKPSGGDE